MTFDVTKTDAYKDGRRAGATNRPKTDNPHPTWVDAHNDWNTGHTDGYVDIGFSKKPKPPRKAAT